MNNIENTKKIQFTMEVAKNVLEFLDLQLKFHKKKQNNFMAPFYGWGSTASRLEPLQGGSLLFTTSSQKFLVLILSISERWQAESTLEPLSGFEDGTPG